jgi:HPt (histidine-containing phosphotransfer) domain-containing protein
VHWKIEDKNSPSEGELKQRLINNFVNCNKNKFSEIEDALAANDIKLAHRLAHTLASNAGQLKKTRLRNISADIEKALKDGENLVAAEQMSVLKKELEAVFAQLAEVKQEQPATAAQTKTLDTSAIRKLFEELEIALKNGDLDCLTFVDDLRLIPETQELIIPIENFDFKPALETLERLKKCAP